MPLRKPSNKGRARESTGRGWVWGGIWGMRLEQSGANSAIFISAACRKSWMWRRTLLSMMVSGFATSSEALAASPRKAYLTAWQSTGDILSVFIL